MGFSATSSLLSFPSLPDPIPAPRSRSCCSRPDSRFPAPLRSPLSLFPGVGATSGLSRERWGHGEDSAGPAEVPWAQPRASGAPRRGWRGNPAPSRARAAARESSPAWSTARGLQGGGGGVHLEDGLWRGNAGEDAAPPPASRARGLCRELGEGGASAPRAPPSRPASARARPRRRPGGRPLPGPLRRAARSCALVRIVPTPGPSLPRWLVCLRGGWVHRAGNSFRGAARGERRRREPNETLPPAPSSLDVCGGDVGPYTSQNRSPPPRSGFFGEIRRALAYSLLFLGEGLVGPPY